jgi:aldose 1-epimerase
MDKVFSSATLWAAVLCAFGMFSCKPSTPPTETQEANAPAGEFSITKDPWGTLEGNPVSLYTLTAPNGFTAKITDYGATLVSLLAPDKEGKLGDVILGFDSLSGYLQPGNPYFGCTVGRYANRIANARFTLNGKTYPLAPNDNGNTLHGGRKGFDKVLWGAAFNRTDSTVTLALSYTSPDGEEGFPGNLSVTVAFTLDNTYGLQIAYSAQTDKQTPINLTNHAYFNLSAGQAPDILGHELRIKASYYTPVNAALIPTGEIAPTAQTPFDFSFPKPIGLDIAKVPGGYDHNFIFNTGVNGPVATLYDPGSGRFMEMSTTEPAVQFYSGNFLDGSLKGRGGQPMTKHYGLCLEAQHYPDSPNQPTFPNTVLQPSQMYVQFTTYRFSVR